MPQLRQINGNGTDRVIRHFLGYFFPAKSRDANHTRKKNKRRSTNVKFKFVEQTEHYDYIRIVLTRY